MWGIVLVYFCRAFQSLLLDKRTAPHFLFYFTMPSRSWEATNIVVMDALKSILDQSVSDVLSNLPVGEDNEFDTHDFITAFLNFNEPVYADLFVRYKDACRWC